MTEKNVDRLWFVVGAIVVGAVIIFIFRNEIGTVINAIIHRLSEMLLTSDTQVTYPSDSSDVGIGFP